MSALIVYTDKHFKYEEELFVTYNYPGYEEHKREHDELTRQVQELNAKFTAGSASFSMEMMRFLKAWVIEHIMQSDKKYSAFLNDKGIK